MVEKLFLKMTEFYVGNRSDIEHFVKVHAYARELGKLEGLDEQTLFTLEAAVVHDIACPLCREKYGNTDGINQEHESEALLRPFLAEFNLESAVLERIIHLVTHHHTYTNVDGIDYQILLEADFLVNSGESGYPRESIESFRERVFKTASGKRLLKLIYGV